MWNRINEYVVKYLGEESFLRGPVLALLTLALVWVLYRILTKALKRYLNRKAHKYDNTENFLLLWRYVWLALALTMTAIALSGSITTIGISAAFIGMILGWSLQAPVTGLAAWLMIILKQPFKLGDRIIVSGIVGDVVDINLTHIVLNQVGGTVGGEEKSGRGVMVPNAILFQQIIHNYSFQNKFLLDEVPVLITYESDYDEAESILLSAAQKVTSETVPAPKDPPYVRAELADSGIRLRLRYQTLAVERQRISSEIVKRIITAFNRTKTVEFAYPHTEVLHRAKAELPRKPVEQM